MYCSRNNTNMGRRTCERLPHVSAGDKSRSRRHFDRSPHITQLCTVQRFGVPETTWQFSVGHAQPVLDEISEDRQHGGRRERVERLI